MYTSVGVQQLVNQSTNVEKAQHGQSQAHDEQAHRFALQIEQERQSARGRVQNPQNAKDLHDKNPDEKQGKRKKDPKEAGGSETDGSDGAAVQKDMSRLVDILV